MHFTFKKESRMTGLSAVATPNSSTTVKLNGEVCGSINAPSRFSTNKGWKPALMVKSTVNENCDWSWVFFKAEFETEAEARKWFKKNEKGLLEKYEIHLNGKY